MFKFLKEKLKETVKKFSNAAQTEAEVIEQEIEEPITETQIAQVEKKELPTKSQEFSSEQKEIKKEHLKDEQNQSKPKQKEATKSSQSQKSQEKNISETISEQTNQPVSEDTSKTPAIGTDSLAIEVEQTQTIDTDSPYYNKEKSHKDATSTFTVPSVEQEEDTLIKKIEETPLVQNKEEPIVKKEDIKVTEDKKNILSKQKEEPIEESYIIEESDDVDVSADLNSLVDIEKKELDIQDTNENTVASNIENDVDESSSVDETKIPEQTSSKEEKKGFFSRLFHKNKKEDKDELVDFEKEITEDIDEPLDENIHPEKELKKGIKEQIDADTKEYLEDNIETDFKDDFKKKVDEDVEQDTDNNFEEELDEDIEKDDDVDSKKETQSTSVKKQSKDVPLETVFEKPISREAVHKDLLENVKDDVTRKKAGFFTKIKQQLVKFKLTDEVFEDLFWEFELALLENNVALEVIEKIKHDLKESLTTETVSRKGIEQTILDSLKQSLEHVLDVPTVNLLEKISTKKPYVICVVGVNGSGKTTTLAKLIHYFQKNNLSLVVAASDTFRAAAIQQLEEHTTKLGVKLIKHDYNADPAAVAFDAIKHATAKNLDIVLIDTAGRLQSNSNLMDELRKLVRVNKPDFNLFIGESITGNDCVEQAVAFNDIVGIDGIVLSKADVDERGGAAISISYMTKKPILFLGTGQTYDDLTPFDKDELLKTLGL